MILMLLSFDRVYPGWFSSSTLANKNRAKVLVLKIVVKNSVNFDIDLQIFLVVLPLLLFLGIALPV